MDFCVISTQELGPSYWEPGNMDSCVISKHPGGVIATRANGSLGIGRID